MKKWMLLSIMLGAMPLSMMAQDDDMYFVPTKANVAKQKAEYGVPQNTYYSGSSRSVEDYNRRGSAYEVLPADTGDVISFSAVEGVYPDSLGDFALTRQMQRWDGYEPSDDYWAGYSRGRSDGWYGWHSPWYWSSYYPWYDYGWYDPWYYGSWYGGWYNPWYYSGWGWGGYYNHWYYRPSWYYGWYGGGGYYGGPGRYYRGHSAHYESPRGQFGRSNGAARRNGSSVATGRGSFGASRTGNGSFGSSRSTVRPSTGSSSGGSFGASRTGSSSSRSYSSGSSVGSSSGGGSFGGSHSSGSSGGGGGGSRGGGSFGGHR